MPSSFFGPSGSVSPITSPFLLSLCLPPHPDPPCQLDILVSYKEKKVRIKSEENKKNTFIIRGLCKVFGSQTVEAIKFSSAYNHDLSSSHRRYRQ